MNDLRARLIALAETFPPHDYAHQHDYAEAIALAAARMALADYAERMDRAGQPAAAFGAVALAAGLDNG